MRLGLRRNGAQRIEIGLQSVETGQQWLDILRTHRLGIDLLNGGLHAVRHLTQPQRASQTRTAFERVQGAQHLVARAQVAWTRCPLAQRAAQTGQQLQCFVLEKLEKVSVNHIECIDVVVHVADRSHCAGNGIVDFLVHVLAGEQLLGRSVSAFMLRCGMGKF